MKTSRTPDGGAQIELTSEETDILIASIGSIEKRKTRHPLANALMKQLEKRNEKDRETQNWRLEL